MPQYALRITVSNVACFHMLRKCSSGIEGLWVMANGKKKTRKVKPPAAQDLFGTKQVAQILRLPEWRVQSFVEGGRYRMFPTAQVGSGRGSRRLFSSGDVFNIGVANKLVEHGFNPEAVGEALGKIPLDFWDEFEEDTAIAGGVQRLPALKPGATIFLAHRSQYGGLWAWSHENAVTSLFQETLKPLGAAPDLFILNVWQVAAAVFQFLDEYRKNQQNAKQKEEQS